MGNNNSLQAEGFSKDEIARLAKRFKKLDIDHSGAISVEEFLNVPENKQNPLVQRVAEIFDKDQNGEVDFKEFVQGLADFVTNSDVEQKLKFVFNIYDVDRDGYISYEELFTVLKKMVGKNLTEEKLDQVIKRTIIQLDKDTDARISYPEFRDLVLKKNIHQKLDDQLTIHKDEI